MKIGSCIGIYGESGSGKSTLINLLSGLICPANGEVFLSNSASGMRYKYSYDRVYICPQEPFLIDDTLIKNISLNDNPNEAKAKSA